MFILETYFYFILIFIHMYLSHSQMFYTYFSFSKKILFKVLKYMDKRRESIYIEREDREISSIFCLDFIFRVLFREHF